MLPSSPPVNWYKAFSTLPALATVAWNRRAPAITPESAILHIVVNKFIDPRRTPQIRSKPQDSFLAGKQPPLLSWLPRLSSEKLFLLRNQNRRGRKPT